MRYTTRIVVPPKIRRSGIPGGKEAKYAPQVIGVRKSFGFGDWLGLAAPGHIRAVGAYRDWAPFFAQHTPAEETVTNRTAQEALRASLRAVEEAGYRPPWGADANRLQTPIDVEAAAGAGFTLFTFDPSDLIDQTADRLPPEELNRRITTMILDGALPENWSEPYLDRSIDLPGDWKLEMALEPLQRAAVKFGRAIPHCLRLYESLTRARRGQPFEIEVCLDKTAAPITPLEHLFVGLELEARGLRSTSLALRLAAGFESAFDYRGNLEAFEDVLRKHIAIAQFCGPYKLSVHGGSDKFSAYPMMGRVCGDQLHVKTAGTTYLEGLRAVQRVDPALFMEIARHGQEQFAMQEAPSETLLDEPAGRQMLLAAHSSLLTEARMEDGRLFREAVVETLQTHPDVYHELIAAHFEKHLSALNAG